MGIADLFAVLLAAVLVYMAMRIKNKERDEEDDIPHAPPMSDPLPPLPVEDDGKE